MAKRRQGQGNGKSNKKSKKQGEGSIVTTCTNEKKLEKSNGNQQDNSNKDRAKKGRVQSNNKPSAVAKKNMKSTEHETTNKKKKGKQAKKDPGKRVPFTMAENQDGSLKVDSLKEVNGKKMHPNKYLDWVTKSWKYYKHVLPLVNGPNSTQPKTVAEKDAAEILRGRIYVALMRKLKEDGLVTETMEQDLAIAQRDFMKDQESIPIEDMKDVQVGELILYASTPNGKGEYLCHYVHGCPAKAGMMAVLYDNGSGNDSVRYVPLNCIRSGEDQPRRAKPLSLPIGRGIVEGIYIKGLDAGLFPTDCMLSKKHLNDINITQMMCKGDHYLLKDGSGQITPVTTALVESWILDERFLPLCRRLEGVFVNTWPGKVGSSGDADLDEDLENGYNNLTPQKQGTVKCVSIALIFAVHAKIVQLQRDTNSNERRKANVLIRKWQKLLRALASVSTDQSYPDYRNAVADTCQEWGFEFRKNGKWDKKKKEQVPKFYPFPEDPEDPCWEPCWDPVIAQPKVQGKDPHGEKVPHFVGFFGGQLLEPSARFSCKSDEDAMHKICATWEKAYKGIAISYRIRLLPEEV